MNEIKECAFSIAVCSNTTTTPDGTGAFSGVGAPRQRRGDSDQKKKERFGGLSSRPWACQSLNGKPQETFPSNLQPPGLDVAVQHIAENKWCKDGGPKQGPNHHRKHLLIQHVRGSGHLSNQVPGQQWWVMTTSLPVADCRCGIRMESNIPRTKLTAKKLHSSSL